MSNYYQAIKNNEGSLPEVLKFFEEEYKVGQQEIKTTGKNLTECCAKIASFYEYRMSQLQELEAILKHFEMKISKEKSELYKKYLENYNRVLTSTDIKNYIEGQPTVVALQTIINEITLVRNKFISLTTGFATMNYQLSNLSRLYASGIDGIIL